MYSGMKGVELRYRVVDVFSDVPLAGNALCVVLDPCPEPVMAAIAREVNLSETTFPVVTGSDTYDLRIFTPAVELPFAGHPTLGTAWVLGPGSWTQTTEGATVRVEAESQGAVMDQPYPALTEVAPEPAREALGLARAESVHVGEAGGLRHLITATGDSIERLAPDVAALRRAAKHHRATTVCVVRRLDDHALQVRVFAPGAGIGEDPGTGSAAGPIAVLARRSWGTDSQLTIFQGSEIGRPSRIEVDVGDDRVRVGGRVTACAEGRFSL